MNYQNMTIDELLHIAYTEATTPLELALLAAALNLRDEVESYMRNDDECYYCGNLY